MHSDGQRDKNVVCLLAKCCHLNWICKALFMQSPRSFYLSHLQPCPVSIGFTCFFVTNHHSLLFCKLDSENGKVSGSTGGLPGDGSMSCPSSGNPNKSPLRSRKSSLSAVIDKLRLQHNPESDVFQNSGKALPALKLAFCFLIYFVFLMLIRAQVWCWSSIEDGTIRG